VSTNVLPDGWTLKKFSAIAASITERVDDPSASGVERYVGLEHLDPESTTIRRWGSPSDVEATKLRFYPGDVIYGRRRAYQRKLGVADFDGICSAHALVLRAKPDVCLPEFLPYFLQSDAFHQRALDISVGSLSPTINWKTLAVQEFALPPIDVQARTASVMNKVDNLINAYGAVPLDELRTALYSTEIRRSEQVKLSSLAEINPENIREAHGDEWQSRYIDISSVSRSLGIDFRQLAEITSSNAPSRAQRVVRTGDILVSTVRPALRAVAVVPRELDSCIASTGFAVLRAEDEGIQSFLWGLVQTKTFAQFLMSRAVGTNYPAVKSSDIGDYPVDSTQLATHRTIGLQNSVLSAVELDRQSAVAEARQLRHILLNRLLGC
jgi:type I restriction enzyme S subunit